MRVLLFSPVDITPEGFASMSPALQTEAIRLMAEAGHGLSDMEAATGLDRKAMLTIGSRRHQVRAFEFERVDGDAAKAARADGIVRGPKLSPAAKLLIGHMHNQCCVLAESLVTVAYDLGVSEKSLHNALRQLMTWGFIEKTRDGTGRVAAQYRLTKTGEALAPAADPAESGEACHD